MYIQANVLRTILSQKAVDNHCTIHEIQFQTVFIHHFATFMYLKQDKMIRKKV